MCGTKIFLNIVEAYCAALLDHVPVLYKFVQQGVKLLLAPYGCCSLAGYKVTGLLELAVIRAECHRYSVCGCLKDIVDTYKKIKLITKEDTRFFHCNIKTLNLIPSVIASQDAKEAGCDETVLHRGNRVTECAHSNVHIIQNGVFRTAPTDNLILPGIARAHLIKACNKLGIPVDETAFTLQDLMEADEVIVSSSGSLCLAAEVIDGKPVGGKAPELLKKLQDEVLREFNEETKA